MTTPLPLDTRQARIARRLLETVGPASVDDARDRAQADRPDGPLQPRLGRERPRRARPAAGPPVAGSAIWVEGSPAARQGLLDALDRSTGPAVLDPTDRRGRILLALLAASPEPLRSEALEERLGVSRADDPARHARRRGLARAAPAPPAPDARAGHRGGRQRDRHARRHARPPPGDRPGPGAAAPRGGRLGRDRGRGRAGASELPGAGTAPAAARTDVEAFLASLDLATFRTILGRELRDLDERDPTLTTAALSLAIAAHRIRAGRAVRLGGGRLRSLLDHPVAESRGTDRDRRGARPPASPFSRTDVAAITESLLGLTQLVDVAARPEAADVRYIDRIIAAAASRLHASLAADEQLRSSLSEHVRRLHVRLRFGLPISNPLQQEVRRRYPDVYRAAAEILAEVGPVAGTDMPVEEIGLLTMYLAGSLERHRLRPKVRVTVVCPAGMATAWILVSRLVAEFPQIEVIRVVSKAAFEIGAGRRAGPHRQHDPARRPAGRGDVDRREPAAPRSATSGGWDASSGACRLAWPASPARLRRPVTGERLRHDCHNLRADTLALVCGLVALRIIPLPTSKGVEERT